MPQNHGLTASADAQVAGNFGEHNGFYDPATANNFRKTQQHQFYQWFLSLNGQM